MPVRGDDGVWYAGEPPAAPGGWKRAAAAFGRALWAPFRALGGVSKRAISSLPWASGGGWPVMGGERALALVPLFACVRILADQVASLPVQTYRKLGDRRQPMPALPQLLQSPAARGTLFDWLHRAMVSLALRGNAYGLIVQRDGFGFPTQIEWLHPDDVWVDEQRPTLPLYYWMGVEVPREDIMHIPWFVMPGKVVGLSPVAAFATTIGVGLAAVDYGKSWFDGGGTPPATMKNNQKTLNPQEAAEIRDRLMASIRAGKPLVYGMDWDFTALKVNPEESQFIETMRLNAAQIAAIYGVPPEMVAGESGASMTYANVEQQAIRMETMTLRPWLVRLESALSAQLPERQFMRFNADAMIRTDLLTRYRAHASALDKQWRTVNETRAIEDLPPVPWGDEPNPIPGAPPKEETAPADGGEPDDDDQGEDPEEEGARGE
jgi:HK97 family phage portal protein